MKRFKNILAIMFTVLLLFEASAPIKIEASNFSRTYLSIPLKLSVLTMPAKEYSADSGIVKAIFSCGNYKGRIQYRAVLTETFMGDDFKKTESRELYNTKNHYGNYLKGKDKFTLNMKTFKIDETKGSFESYPKNLLKASYDEIVKYKRNNAELAIYARAEDSTKAYDCKISFKIYIGQIGLHTDYSKQDPDRVPKIEILDSPADEYGSNDPVEVVLKCTNYSGKVQYRMTLKEFYINNDSMKSETRELYNTKDHFGGYVNASAKTLLALGTFKLYPDKGTFKPLPEDTSAIEDAVKFGTNNGLLTIYARAKGSKKAYDSRYEFKITVHHITGDMY